MTFEEFQQHQKACQMLGEDVKCVCQRCQKYRRTFRLELEWTENA